MISAQAEVTLVEALLLLRARAYSTEPDDAGGVPGRPRPAPAIRSRHRIGQRMTRPAGPQASGREGGQ